MSEKEVDALAIWIQSLIDQKIEQAFGRDSTHEWVRESELRQDIYALMGDIQMKWEEEK